MNDPDSKVMFTDVQFTVIQDRKAANLHILEGRTS